MPDREKVIKGIDICLQRSHCGEDCPYYDNDCRLGCMELLRGDALAMLKEQEPRVLTLEEACGLDVCWLEWRKYRKKLIACRIIMRMDYAGQPIPYVYRFFGKSVVYSKKKYGKDWRCWSAIPTEYRRMEVKWDEGVYR